MRRRADSVQIREMVKSDAHDILSLNQSVVSKTSPLDADKFNRLFEQSSSKWVAVADGQCVGFLIAMAQGIDYKNDNYRWFSRKLDGFLYVDRVVVSSANRGLGVGKILYSHAFAAARHAGLKQVSAEIDVEPPNLPSLGFHKKIGFVEVGTRHLASGKRVSLQVCPVSETS